LLDHKKIKKPNVVTVDTLFLESSATCNVIKSNTVTNMRNVRNISDDF